MRAENLDHTPLAWKRTGRDLKAS